jgi:hypothetical protein
VEGLVPIPETGTGIGIIEIGGVIDTRRKGENTEEEKIRDTRGAVGGTGVGLRRIAPILGLTNENPNHAVRHDTPITTPTDVSGTFSIIIIFVNF